MGAKILGAGTNKITIYGVDKLVGTEYKPIGDRIVAGTIMSAVAICGGEVKISNALPYQNLKLIEILTKMGCQINYKNDILHISRDKPLLCFKEIKTGFYPEFPTDLQSILLAVACFASGESKIIERVFENRFLTVSELSKLNAKIYQLDKHSVIVAGENTILGNTIEAMDLRGGASLVLAGLGAKGTTLLKNIHFIDRGYENLEKTLSDLGANIRRI